MRTVTMNQEISEDVWGDKYKYGEENSIEDTQKRMARGICGGNRDSKAFLQEVETALVERRMIPAGRVHAGAGTDKRVTLINCFVSDTIQDSLTQFEEGATGLPIMKALEAAAATQQMGGGIGMNFSTLRPAGAIVKRTGSVSSGVLPFMDMWHGMCQTIMSSGSRRGAMMGTLSIWHPDVERFIVAKQTKGRLTNFNVSLLVTNSFMEAVRADKDWDLVFHIPRADGDHVDTYEKDGVTYFVYKRVRARDLWELATNSTYIYAEPGIIFIDRVNEMNNLYYCEDIQATNPCLTGDTWVTTHEGARQIKELIGETTRLMLQTQTWLTSGFFSTGKKMVKRLITKEGYEIEATGNHKFQTLEGEWKTVDELQPGDELNLSRGQCAGPQPLDPKAYLLGYVFGDGWLGLKEGRVGIQTSHRASTDSRKIITDTHRSAFGKAGTWSVLGDREQSVFRSRELAEYTQQFNLLKKDIGDLEKEDNTFWSSFIGGLIDSDGTIYKSEKGSYVRIYQSDKALLQSIQRIVLRMGVYSKIYQQRPERQDVQMPGGYYNVKAQFCLHVSGQDMKSLLDFAHILVKKESAENVVSTNLRGWYKKTAKAIVETVEDLFEKEVFDVQVPGPNAYEANGFVSHNCGEQPLPPNGDCNLGHVNLAVMVLNPFGDKPEFDYDKLERTVTTLVRFQDNVIDASLYPTEAQKEEAFAKRRLGIGYTGLANALQQMKIAYGSTAAIEVTRRITKALALAAYRASIELAKERGSFPAFDCEKYLKAAFIKKLPKDIRAGIKEHGIRNAVLLTLAPTGTISIVAGNVSSGIEPSFSFSYDRKVLRKDEEGVDYQKEYTVYDYGYLLYYRTCHPDQPVGSAALPSYMNTAMDLTVEEHLLMQAAAQEWIDSSISKTVNCPTEMELEEFQNVYLRAHDLGLKGCTTYRFDPRSERGSVLSTGKKTTPQIVDKVPMKEELEGRRYRIKWPQGNAALYVTINDYIDENNQRRPFEIFINTKEAQHDDWLTALTLMITGIFRRGGDVTFITEELKQVISANGGAWVDGKYVGSIVALIGQTIETHFKRIGLINEVEAVSELAEEVTSQLIKGSTCPSCQAPSLVRQEGCKKCINCGFNACG